MGERIALIMIDMVVTQRRRSTAASKVLSPRYVVDTPRQIIDAPRPLIGTAAYRRVPGQDRRVKRGGRGEVHGNFAASRRVSPRHYRIAPRHRRVQVTLYGEKHPVYAVPSG